ncbi:hypothetical protein [Thermodesulfatator autotrophicus]|uniref:Uncharacterized protein n=1 Tax=Thermodesulfatator autotrophicus TaxID=1795632 RepID=A0A177E6F5_9BACT|nr:hypothetical protein [Thermodesulfatator autotrophicus]OAG27543.1 hypothetical protein TH606_06550 [Thermodesulfatator autotrophicus]
MRKLRKFKAVKMGERGERFELWAAADNKKDALLLVSVLMRNGYDVEIGPELPDPPFRFESFVIATPGWGPAVGLSGLFRVSL